MVVDLTLGATAQVLYALAGLLLLFFRGDSDQLIIPLLIGILLLSLLNALTLSLNAFVTLGFGTIPTTGVPRYLCIVQGFLGWFLLSIFTVALINQVLA